MLEILEMLCELFNSCSDNMDAMNTVAETESAIPCEAEVMSTSPWPWSSREKKPTPPPSAHKDADRCKNLLEMASSLHDKQKVLHAITTVEEEGDDGRKTKAVIVGGNYPILGDQMYSFCFTYPDATKK